ncbi:class I SAM-dependent methyltransferase [Mucilaginibacter sp.]|uniref:class I SAM-dependent methyltransferase n=1 Tax=Mucilaginibacter sp. TaxID=1882438 RepID=UPI003D0AFA11
MAANYNNSAWFYDRLSRMVYGKALVNAQVWLLQYIPANSNILVVGGGTGWILDELAKLHPAGLQITYVEVAANMMALSKKRNVAANKITYMNLPIENAELSRVFDVVITPFLFDNFTEQTLQKVFNHINLLIKPNGLWLNADFQLTGKWWQNVLLKTMFMFFRILCNIEASRLPDIETHFKNNGYTVIGQQTFFNEFIISKVYKAGE